MTEFFDTQTDDYELYLIEKGENIDQADVEDIESFSEEDLLY